jgi:hypothetical protein
MTGIKIHIHEDDWGMRSLHPEAAWGEAAADIRKAAEAAVANRDPSGHGFSDLYIINPPKLTFADMGIRLAVLEVALAGVMPRVTEFNATVGGAIGTSARDPYGSYDASPHCFGYGPECFLKIEAVSDLVSAIWFEARNASSEQLACLRATLHIVNELTPVIIADYWLDVGGRVSDEKFLDAYFKELAG